MSGSDQSTDFAPQDPTDGRKPFHWESRYLGTARIRIRLEAAYLLILLFAVPFLLFAIWRRWPLVLIQLLPSEYAVLSGCLYAWLGGTLGGTVFAIKWLYHSVPRGIWNIDRSLWRFFTPHISASLAFAFYLLFSSGLLSVFDAQPLKSARVVVAVSFLAGYFSDAAAAKLAELAQTLFGTTTRSVPRPAHEEFESPRASPSHTDDQIG